VLHLALRPDCATVAVDESQYGRQAAAVALELIGAVEALESAEEAPRIVLVEAGAVVAHRDGALDARAYGRDPDVRTLVAGGGLPRVLELQPMLCSACPIAHHSYVFRPCSVGWQAGQ